jgi:Zn-dependent protease with chaperone function
VTPRPVSVALLALACGLPLPSLGQADDAAPAVSSPEVGASGGKSNWLQRLKSRLPGKKDAAATPAEAPSAAAPDATPSSSPFGGPSKIKDIPVAARGKSASADSTCKNLVEPFGITDSALSLAKFRMECKLSTLKLPLGLTNTPTATSASACDVHQAARQLNWLPMPLELRIGQQAHDRKSASGKLLLDDRRGHKAYETARRLLAGVLAQVREPVPYTFTISVTTLSDGNAEAAPGGFLYLDKDLATRPEEEGLASFALAHEVSHVLQRHETRELQARLTDGMDSFDQLSKSIAATQADPDFLLKRAGDLKQLYMLHSEQQELQADACGVRLLSTWMTQADLQSSIDAFIQSLPLPQPAQPLAEQTLQTRIASLADGRFSSHPSTQARVKNLKTMLGEVRAGR